MVKHWNKLLSGFGHFLYTRFWTQLRALRQISLCNDFCTQLSAEQPNAFSRLLPGQTRACDGFLHMYDSHLWNMWSTLRETIALASIWIFHGLYSPEYLCKKSILPADIGRCLGWVCISNVLRGIVNGKVGSRSSCTLLRKEHEKSHTETAI